MNIVLFGAPGAGKGTQSSLLVAKGMKQISTGDLFRAAMKNKTDLGQQAKSFMDAGSLVPDSIVIGMVKEVLEKDAQNTSFILDGFPRTVAQAQALDELLKDLKITLDQVISLEVPMAVLLKRLSGRRVCQNCGTVYHVESKPPSKAGVCDVCGGAVVQRKDDHEDVIGNRLKVYEEFTSPLKAYYRSAGKYVEVDGNRDAELVFKDLEKMI